jgi:hypothetical protein
MTDSALKSMVAPGQESILEDFLSGQEGEQEQAPIQNDPLEGFLQEQEKGDDDGLPEKYRGKSAAEVYRLAQQEAEYRAGQQQKQEPAKDLTIPEFTKEKAAADYGEALAGVFEAAEINPYEIDAKVRAGQEIDPEVVDKLVANTGFPKSVVEGYINSFRPAPAAAQQGQPLGDAEKGQLVAAIGGPEQAARVNQWITENGDQAEVDAFNQLVDAGNATAARAMLKGFAAQAQAAMRREPELVSGGTAGAADGLSFADDDEAVAAMKKTDQFGRNLYKTDPVYRKKVEAAMARSSVFF